MTGTGRPAAVKLTRLSFGSPASQCTGGGGGFRPLLIPHSIDPAPPASMPQPQTMFPDGVLKAPFFAAAFLERVRVLAC